jgi:putative DNA primase/helicase
MGLTGWARWDAVKGAILGFDEWRKLRQSGNAEESKIVEQVTAFIDKHGDSRFSDKSVDGENSQDQYRINNRAGWWHQPRIDDNRSYLFTSAGFREAIAGFDLDRAIDALVAVGMMEKRNDNKGSVIKIQGRSVRIFEVKQPGTEIYQSQVGPSTLHMGIPIHE